MSHFIVTLASPAGTCYLRSTVWTFAGALDRATRYETQEAARKGLDKAKPFMKLASYKAARVQPLADGEA